LSSIYFSTEGILPGFARKMLLGSLGGMMRIVCKCLRETFGTNGVIFTLLVLQNVMPFCNKMFESGAGDRLGVGLGVLGETFGMGLMRPIGRMGLMS
jgi:hypothetical protein